MSHNDSPPSGTRAVREQLVTATGWRVVGGAIPLVEAAAAAAPPHPAGGEHEVIFAARFQLRPRLARDRVVTLVLAALSTAIRQQWSDAPPLTPDRPLSRPSERYHGLQWATRNDPDAWAGELRWRHPHPVVRGVACTTHLILTEHATQSLLSVTVAAEQGVSGVRGRVGVGQARPAFLNALQDTLWMSFDDGPSEPTTLVEADIRDFVATVLLAEQRHQPVAVISPLETGGYAIEPSALARELVGVAHVYAVDCHPATFTLTDAVGDRRLSCFFGAVRVYRPQFSCADRPEDHPLLLRERLTDPVERAALVGQLAPLAIERFRMPPGVMAASPARTSRVPNSTGDARLAVELPEPAAGRSGVVNTVSETASESALQREITYLGSTIGTLADTITQLVRANAALRDEIARLRTTTAVRATSTTALERRIGSLEQLLRTAPGAAAGSTTGTATRTPVATHSRTAGTPHAMAAEASEAEQHDDDEDEDKDEALTLLDVLRQAAATHSDALLILDAAEQAATRSPYEDTDRVAVILDAMAVVSRRRMDGALGATLRDVFREHGIDYRSSIAPSTSQKHRQQYRVQGSGNTVYECREHIVLGASYDPRHCLRIYFTSRDATDPRFVIGHVGKHFTVKTTT